MHFLPTLKTEDKALICSYTISSQEATVKWGARNLCNHRNSVFNAMQMLTFFYKLNYVTVIKWIQRNKSSVKYTEIPHLDCNQLCCLSRLLALLSLSQVYDLILQAPQIAMVWKTFHFPMCKHIKELTWVQAVNIKLSTDGNYYVCCSSTQTSIAADSGLNALSLTCLILESSKTRLLGFSRHCGTMLTPQNQGIPKTKALSFWIC